MTDIMKVRRKSEKIEAVEFLSAADVPVILEWIESYLPETMTVKAEITQRLSTETGTTSCHIWTEGFDETYWPFEAHLGSFIIWDGLRFRSFDPTHFEREFAVVTEETQ